MKKNMQQIEKYVSPASAETKIIIHMMSRKKIISPQQSEIQTQLRRK